MSAAALILLLLRLVGLLLVAAGGIGLAAGVAALISPDAQAAIEMPAWLALVFGALLLAPGLAALAARRWFAAALRGRTPQPPS